MKGKRPFVEVTLVLSAHDLLSIHGEDPAPAVFTPVHTVPPIGCPDRRAERAERLAAPAPAPVFKPNAFPGTCVNCGVRIEANGGLRDKRDGKWVVFHSGDCPVVEVPPAAEGTQVPSAAPADLPIWTGKYTLITEAGHRTFKVEVDPDFADGTPTIAFLRGSDNQSDYTSFGFIKGTPERPRINVWKRFQGEDYTSLNADVALFLANLPTLITMGLGDDPEVWDSLAVGTILQAKYCSRCPAELTNPDSIRAGIGPVCATK